VVAQGTPMTTAKRVLAGMIDEFGASRYGRYWSRI
jgi:hypothetical protein